MREAKDYFVSVKEQSVEILRNQDTTIKTISPITNVSNVINKSFWLHMKLDFDALVETQDSTDEIHENGQNNKLTNSQGQTLDAAHCSM